MTLTTYRAIVGLLALVQILSGRASAQNLRVDGDRFQTTRDAGDTSGAWFGLVISGREYAGGPPATLRFRGVIPTVTFPIGTPNFLIVTPAESTTPANGAVLIDPEVTRYLAPGSYTSTFRYELDEPNASSSSGAVGSVTLFVRTPPLPRITGVVNAASLRPAIAPGAVVSIFGAYLGSATSGATYDKFGMYPTTFINSTVRFNDIAAPLTYVSPTQINAIVPHELSGQSTARVTVVHHGQRSAEFAVSLTETAPGIYTASQDGNGQGAIQQTPPVFGYPRTVNSVENPVEKGGAILFYATGSGLWNQDVRAGQILFVPHSSSLTVLPKGVVAVKIGGIPARQYYAGGAFGHASMLQVTAFVPQDIASGPNLIELTVGGNSNLPQQVIVHVK